MFTIFSIPKPFVGHIGVIQRNAIESWTRLSAKPEVILFGDEPGIAEAARDLRVRHVPSVSRNEWGTPLLDDVFAKAHALATHELLCYANGDIILLDSFYEALLTVSRKREKFLITGQRTNLDITEPLSASPDWQARLLAQVRREGKRYGPLGMDYFAFRKGLWREIPPFAVGRVCWDNWMIFSAKERGADVIDVTYTVCAIHQNHSYAHITHSEHGQDWVWNGPEALRNRALAGGWDSVLNLYDVPYLLLGKFVVRALTYQHLQRQAFPRVRRRLRWIRRRALPRARLLRLYYTLIGTPERARDLPR